MILATRRLFAGIVDCLLLGSYIICACSFVFQWELVSERSPFFAVFAVCVPFFYFTLLESGFGGSSTLGKRLLGLEVLDRTLGQVPIYRSALRSTAKIIGPSLVIFGAMQLTFHRPVVFGSLIL